jgi:hypothetical protein
MTGGSPNYWLPISRDGRASRHLLHVRLAQPQISKADIQNDIIAADRRALE